MDEAFLQELDAHITNVGTDKCWKRRIGGMEIWFSPIPYDAQLRVNETIANEDLGTAAVQETKRIALSHSIVGFDGYDLRKYRNAGPVFPMVVSERGKDGKTVRRDAKVELHKYIHAKLAGWDSELVDLAFEVFADLMESNKKDALKEVKFENAKDPVDELAEVEARAAELRESLGLPQMVEDRDARDGDREGRSREELEADEPLDVPDVPPVRAREPDPDPEPGFDPFRPVRPSAEVPAEAPVRSVPVPEPPSAPQKSPIELELEARSRAPSSSPAVLQPDAHGRGPTSSPERPYQATPSVDVGVVESPGERKVVDPPKVDRRPGGQSRNPRFNPPSGR